MVHNQCYITVTETTCLYWLMSLIMRIGRTGSIYAGRHATLAHCKDLAQTLAGNNEPTYPRHQRVSVYFWRLAYKLLHKMVNRLTHGQDMIANWLVHCWLTIDPQTSTDSGESVKPLSEYDRRPSSSQLKINTQKPWSAAVNQFAMVRIRSSTG